MQQPILRLLGEVPKSIPFSDFMTLGKSPHCQVQMDHDGISERHARIEKKDHGYIIRDLRSEKGTYVNNAQVLEAFLHEGDIVRIGAQEILFTIDKKETVVFPMKSRKRGWILGRQHHNPGL